MQDPLRLCLVLVVGLLVLGCAREPAEEATDDQTADTVAAAPTIAKSPGSASNNTGTACTGGKARAARAPNPTAVTHSRHPRRAAR